jgi:hypothetical protein
MHAQRGWLRWTIALSCTAVLVGVRDWRLAAEENQDRVGTERPLRVAFSLARPWYYGRIEGVNGDGSLNVAPARKMPPAAELSESNFLAVLHDTPEPSLHDPRLLRVVVTECLDAGRVKLRVSAKAVEAMKPGVRFAIFRPAGMTTAQLAQFPEGVVQAEGDAAWPMLESDVHACRAESLNKLKIIGMAMHRYHLEYNCFPPAAIVGPDGKPWHSWRVLLLPFIGQEALYNEYKLDEPWNGPNNQRLLEKTPDLYSDPIYGENKDFLTHYAAITGRGMAFWADGPRFDGTDLDLSKVVGMRLAAFRDGTSATLIVGPVGPERAIPWTKPEDVVVAVDSPRPGLPGGFAFPYPTRKGHAGPFLCGDGTVLTIPAGIDSEVFHAALTRSGREIVGAEDVRGDDLPVVGVPVPVLYITNDGRKASARLVTERGDWPSSILPPDAAQR